MRSVLRTVTRAQGWYYLLGGLWRLVHPASFDKIAGPKPDAFQTDATAAVFAGAGLGLIAGNLRPTLPTRVLAIGTACAVTHVDLKHRRRIRALFRAEAALEVAFAAATVAAAATSHHRAAEATTSTAQ